MAERLELGRFGGRLDFDTVPGLWPELAARIASSRALEVSLEGVTHANSAALALLLEGLELAAREGCRLRYLDLPEALLELARVSNVEPFLLGEEAPLPAE